MEWGWDGWYNLGFYSQDYLNTKTTIESTSLKEITKEDMIKNTNEMIKKSIKENVIFVEPPVMMKFYHMMALAGSVEIYGKLLTRVEGGYIVVKDILIPYQAVRSAHFQSYDDQMAKWLYELAFKNNDPESGERRPIEELNAITSSIHGHFHSHNSLHQNGKPTPSATDTTDVLEHREGKDYWIEIIGTFGGFSGRIATTTPVRSLVSAEVQLKWWSGIEKTIEEALGKVFIEEITYKKTYKKNNTQKNKKKANKNKRDAKIEEILDKIISGEKDIERVAKGVKNEEMGGFITVEVDEKNPLYLSTDILPVNVQETIWEFYKGCLKEGEKIMADVWGFPAVDYQIHDGYGYVETLLSRLQKKFPEAYAEYKATLARFNLDDDLNSINIDGTWEPTPRTFREQENNTEKTGNKKEKMGGK